MYRVLLVDDEPLVLAGIKMMIDWEANGCTLVGTARNGEQALASMETLRPHIVIADISMPVMDGMELLKRAESDCPQTVFIILTNLEEFSLARDSLRHRAVDYLIKTQLEADTLEKSIATAKKEVENRRNLSEMEHDEAQQHSDGVRRLKEDLERLLASSINPEELRSLWTDERFHAPYRIIEILFHYPYERIAADGFAANAKQLSQWEREVAREIAGNCFASCVVTNLLPEQESIAIAAFGVDEADDALQLETFRRKLNAASQKITGVSPSMLATGVFSAPAALTQCRTEILTLRTQYYHSGERFLVYTADNTYRVGPFILPGFASRLRTELRGRNAHGAALLLEQATGQAQHVMHDRPQGIWLCAEVYSAAHDILGVDHPGYGSMRYLLSKADVLQYLAALQMEIAAHLQPGASRQDEIVREVEQYVQDHIDQRITLQDAASSACISPGYLSGIYKKHRGENFVDYINRSKMDRACELLRQGGHRISQVSLMLGFENAYYFTRVFKRYVGMTPSEYQDQRHAGQ